MIEIVRVNAGMLGRSKRDRDPMVVENDAPLLGFTVIRESSRNVRVVT
jgi:hypothetical protein